MIVLYIYKTRLASNEIFSPLNKIHREVGGVKDLSAPRYLPPGLTVKKCTFYAHRMAMFLMFFTTN
jgi:hypothetical protein